MAKSQIIIWYSIFVLSEDILNNRTLYDYPVDRGEWGNAREM